MEQCSLHGTSQLPVYNKVLHRAEGPLNDSRAHRATLFVTAYHIVFFALYTSTSHSASFEVCKSIKFCGIPKARTYDAHTILRPTDSMQCSKTYRSCQPTKKRQAEEALVRCPLLIPFCTSSAEWKGHERLSSTQWVSPPSFSTECSWLLLFISLHHP